LNTSRKNTRITIVGFPSGNGTPAILRKLGVTLTIKVSRLTVEWYGNAGKPFIQLDPAELATEGITLHENLAMSRSVHAGSGMRMQ
jgi:hypothetical protein